MQSKEQKKAKIIFSDAGHDKAISGIIVSEDEFFIVLIGFNGKTYRIGKKAIVTVEDLGVRE